MRMTKKEEGGYFPPSMKTNPENLFLQFHNFLGLIAFGTLRHGEFDLVAFIQGLETATLNGGMVYENIVP